ncbi:competence protein ComEC [Paenibacillus sp. DS2015]|uniref:ComEC/Rec2 family competence protein n=1 Tax=Paenibacillus sp. DS2015 TaxID=3373917 RepID=UPI003D20A092
MKGRPLLIFTLAWVIGSSVACLYSGKYLMGMWVGITCFLLASVWILKERVGLIIVVWVTMTVSGGYWEWHDYLNVTSIPSSLQQEEIKLEGMVVEVEGMMITAVAVDGDRADLQVRLSEINESNVSEKVLVQVKLQNEEQKHEAEQWRRGDLMKLSGTLEKPATARNFDGFDYRKYLRTKDIHWIMKVQGIQNVEVASPSSWSMISIFRVNDQLREALAFKITQLFQEPHAGYMKGLIIGMQEDVDTFTYSQFSQLGLTHILAVSGTHVAVYIVCLMVLLSLFRLTRETKYTVVILLVPIYVLLTGFSPSVIRAGIMSMITLYAARQGLLKDGVHIISAAAFMMLVWNPYLLLNVSFQLSFIVTLGLLIYVPLLMPMLSKLPRKFAIALGITIVAQLISFPLTIYYFNQFSLLSVIANLILVPVISSLTMPLGMFTLVVGAVWSSGGRGVAWLVEWLNNITFALVEWMNTHEAFIMIWRSPSILWICSYYIALYFLLYFIRNWLQNREPLPAPIDDTMPLDGLIRGEEPKLGDWRKEGLKWKQLIIAPAVILFIVLLYIGYRPDSLRGAGVVQFLDVGQGDSILITTPEGKNILVDGGGTVNFRKPEENWRTRKDPFEVGAKVVVPLLKKRGIHHLDAVVLTHGDQDHAGGLQAVLNQIPVKAFLFNGTTSGTKGIEQLLITAIVKSIPTYAIHEGMFLQTDQYTEMTFLSPEVTGDEQAGLPLVKEQNHSSIAFILNMNGVRMLFTGDMDIASENNILQDESKLSLRTQGVEVIKIAHHGSKTSTSEEWLSAWNASTAVISAGVNNLYGHPNSDVVTRIMKQDMDIYRTDLQGEIQMKVYENKVWVRNKLK